MHEIKTFVVISLGWLGDTLLNSTLCQNIKENYPDSKLYLITANPFKEVALGLPGVDQVFEYDKKKYTGLKGIYHFAKDFPYKDKIDCVINTHAHERSIILSALIGAKIRIAAPIKGFNPINMLITHKYRYTEKQIRTTFKADFNSSYLSVLNIKSPLKNMKFEYPEKYNQIIKEKLMQNGLDNEDYIVLCPISKDEIKDWSVENIRSFIEKSKYKVVLTGTQKTAEMAEKLNDLNYINLTNKTSIFELAALIKNSKASVSVDTGTMHISYSVGTPTLCLFFNKKYIAEWAPQNIPNYSILLGKKRYKTDTEEVITVKDIDADMVLEELYKIITGERNAV